LIKKISLIPIAFLIFTTAAMVATQAQGQQLLQYSNPKIGLALIYPNTFVPIEQESNGVRFNQIDVQYNMGNVLEVGVFRDEPLGQYVSLETYVYNKINFLQQYYENLRLTTPQQVPLGQSGIPGVVVGFVGENSGIQYIGILGVFLHNGSPYSLHYLSDNEVDFKNHYSEASFILNSMVPYGSQSQFAYPTGNQIQKESEESNDGNEQSTQRQPTETVDITQEAAIDHDGDGVTCLDQQKMADEANRILGGIGMAPIGTGNLEEDLRACVAAEKTPDRDDVLRGQGLGPNAGPLPPNIADPNLAPRLPPNIAKPIEPSFRN
jgi:hypothetical protein